MHKKKILAILLVCILLPKNTLLAKQNTPSDSQERSIVSSEVYDTITSEEDLIELAVNQSKNTATTNYNLMSSFDTVDESNTVSDIVATQVEAERVYSDGSIEKDVRVDGFILTDVDTNVVLTSSSYDSYLPKTNSSYGVSAFFTSYFTIVEESIIKQIKPRYIVSSVNYSTVKVSSFVHGYFCSSLDEYATDVQKTIGVPSVNVNYYLYPTNTLPYPNNVLMPLYSYMSVNLANGTSMYLEVDLSAVIKW